MGIEKILIFGVNNLAEMMCYYLELEGQQVEAFVVDKKYIKSNMFCKKPVVAFDEIDYKFNENEYSFCICIGYLQMNGIREKVFRRILEKGYKIINYIHPKAIVGNVELGVGNIVLEGAILGYKTKLGDGNIVYPKALIAHHTNVGDFNFFAVASSIAGSCEIKNRCFFGNSSSTKNGLVIRDKTLIGAGTYVSCSTNENDVYVCAKSYRLDKSSLDFL